MPNKQKILVLIDWFVPGYKAGGPIQSSLNLVLALQENYDIYVLTTDTDNGESIPYPGIVTNQWIGFKDTTVKVFYAQKKTLSLQQIKEQINLIAADFIYLNHLFSPIFVVYPLWLKYRNKISGKMIVCPRGALFDSALSVKPYKKKPFLFLFKLLGIDKSIRFHATNAREKETIQQYFPESEPFIADNLPDLHQPPLAGLIKVPGELTLIFIARIVPIKNLLFVLEVLQKVKTRISLVIVGPIEDAGYWERCKLAIDQLPLTIKVDYRGAKKHEALLQAARQSHLFILPTLGENFGHAIFESLLAGRPVLISDQTPWRNLVEQKAGWDLSLNDADGFVTVIERVAAWDQPAFDEAASAAWHYAENIILKKDYKKQYFKLFS